MRPIAELTIREAQRVRGILFDIDDTLLDHGRLTEVALAALYDAHRAGLCLIAVTGRPSEWGRILCGQWPLDAMITENGAIAWRPIGGRPTRVDWLSPAERVARRQKLLSLVSELMARVPELTPSDDVGGRVSDYTFDVGEFARVEPAAIARAAVEAQRLGLDVKVSSVHAHVTLDRADKAGGVLRLLSEQFGLDPTRARFSHAYIGDSENDSGCFAAFATSVGVANLQGRHTVPPRYITKAPMGLGFAEFVAILRDRASAGSCLADH